MQCFSVFTSSNTLAISCYFNTILKHIHVLVKCLSIISVTPREWLCLYVYSCIGRYILYIYFEKIRRIICTDSLTFDFECDNSKCKLIIVRRNIQKIINNYGLRSLLFVYKHWNIEYLPFVF